MIDLITGKQKDAVGKFLEASRYDPAGHDAADMIKNKNSFLGGPDFPLWSRAAKRLGVAAFEQTYISAMNELEKSIPPTTSPQPSPSR